MRTARGPPLREQGNQGSLETALILQYFQYFPLISPHFTLDKQLALAVLFELWKTGQQL